jgi:hypothetical protein
MASMSAKAKSVILFIAVMINYSTFASLGIKGIKGEKRA